MLIPHGNGILLVHIWSMSRLVVGMLRVLVRAHGRISLLWTLVVILGIILLLIVVPLLLLLLHLLMVMGHARCRIAIILDIWLIILLLRRKAGTGRIILATLGHARA